MTLIARLEAATAGSRELDAEIAVVVRCMKQADGKDVPEWAARNFSAWRAREDGHVEVVHGNGRGGAHWQPPAFSTSLDAALSLVPEGLVIRSTLCADGLMQITECWFWSGRDDARDGTEYVEESAPMKPMKPALALCIAALKARSAP